MPAGGSVDLTAPLATVAVIVGLALLVAHRIARADADGSPLTQIIGDVPAIHPEMKAAADREIASGGRKPKGNRPPGAHTDPVSHSGRGATNR
jgi:hypothetical protein